MSRLTAVLIALSVPSLLSAQDHPDAVTAAPDQYAVEFENDIVRVLRVTYEPGESSPMHSHPAYCVMTVSSAETVSTLPDGTVEEGGGSEVGAFNCVDAEIHSVEHTGTGPLEVILVEFKGRESAM